MIRFQPAEIGHFNSAERARLHGRAVATRKHVLNAIELLMDSPHEEVTLSNGARGIINHGIPVNDGDVFEPMMFGTIRLNDKGEPVAAKIDLAHGAVNSSRHGPPTKKFAWEWPGRVSWDGERS